MFEYLRLPCMATFAAIALSAILFNVFLKKKRAGQIAAEGRADSDSAPRNGPVESAACTCTSPPVSETATSSGHDWEVFLSFRGKDTGAGFTDFLYTSLNSAGIRTFKDDEEHRVGEEFAPELLQAFKQSKISIPIFSKGYASSVWCLKELVQMVECQKTRGQKIMPIFYDVAPSEVLYQTGGYGRAFRSHVKEKRYDEKTMQEWKDALSAVGHIIGWDLHSQEENRQEGEFARKLTQKVFEELKKAHLAEPDCLVSVDNHVDVIMEKIGAGTNETRIIGIHGMGGIGKTTIAKITYNKLADDFENHCFLRDIREKSKSIGIRYLQGQLISDILKVNCVFINDIDEGTQTIKERLSNKRVLLFLDDAEEKKHIDALVGKRDWLGKGSKIIITTRNKDILEVPEVDCSYGLSGMDPHQSLRLFSKHAFGRDTPLDEYINQSKRAIDIARGLPLALEVIGSLLSLTEKEMWDLKLKKLENVPRAAWGASSTHTSTAAQGMATSSGYDDEVFLSFRGPYSRLGFTDSLYTSFVSAGIHTFKDDEELRVGEEFAPELLQATSSGHDWEVFLSFRGKDTRAGFTDFLYTSLDSAGIRTFKDDKGLREGEEFAPELLQAIKRSEILIPIFSEGYASSVWCLKELVQMVECQKTGRQKIMPIFYDVAPSEVRYQTGAYREAFRSHEKKKRYDEKTIQEWRDALKEVSFLNGWDLHSQEENRGQGEFCKTVTHMVFKELKKAQLAQPGCLVNVDNHVDVIMEKIGAVTNETRIIGIHGMGGIGKTTVAKIIYNKLADDFENHCFLRDIRETSRSKGIQYLQNELISDILKRNDVDIKDIDEGTRTIKDRLSNKKVLLLLDDAEEKKHIYALVGKRDWLGEGSKIIITTRNKIILGVPEVDYRYELSGMDSKQSLQLFSKHAFRRNSPLDEYIDQSKRAIDIAGGLPLALEVIGSLLSLTEKEKWDLQLKKLENVPHATIQSRLKISYDVLDVRQKLIFLDIACLFIGYDKDVVAHFWDESSLFPDEAMEVLQNMSLIKIKENNELWMHNQLKQLGRDIVRRESDGKLNKQSSIWNPKKALDLLMLKEKENVEALCLKFDHEGQPRFTYEGFMGLSELRFLQVDGSKENFRAEDWFFWHESPSSVLSTNDFQENLHLLPQLRWLSWHDIPPTFKITIFSMEKVVILDLSRSDIMHNWNGWSHIKAIKNLKVLNMTGCCYLERTPNFDAHPKLERLILRGCSKLVEIDESICQLKRLLCLDVRYCRRLRRLPNELARLAALEELLIDCTLIEEIHNCRAMRKLRIVTASRCPIITIPLSTGELANLEYLSLGDCRSLKRLPDSIGNLKSLIELDISGTRIKELPDSMGNLKNLKIVNMTGSSIRKIPDALRKIEMLKK